MISSIVGYIRQNILEINELFLIPVFQRNYSWSTKQCNQLINDILSIKENDKMHFIGNIICQRVVNNLTYVNENIVIDGQQRITTIFILIKAMIDISNNNVDSDLLKSFFYLKDQKTLKIKLNIEDNKAFKFLIDNDFNQINKNSYIYLNYIFFKNKLENLVNNNDMTIREMITFISKIVFVIINIPNDENAQVIFERINSTGLNLSPSDLIRNYLLMSNYNQELYMNYWYKIETKLKNKNLNQFIHHYTIYKLNKAIPENSVYNEFKSFVNDSKEDKEIILKELKDLSHIYSIMLQIDKHENKNLNKLFQDIFLLNQKTCYPFLMKLFKNYCEKIINLDSFINCIETIRNYIIRRLVVDKNMKNLNKFFANLYNKVFCSISSKDSYFDFLTSFILQVSTTDRIPSNEEIYDSFKTLNLYANKQLCKYILFEIEHYKSKELISYDNITIEHVMPQQLTEDWKIELGVDYNLIHHKYLHNIGNLTLTGYNQNLSNSSFKRKKEILNGKNTKFNKINNGILLSENWSEMEIKNRLKYLCNEFNKVFPIKKPDLFHEFTNLNNFEETLDNFNSVIGKSLIYFELLGDKFFTKNWSEMLKISLNKFYNYDAAKLLSLAIENYSFKNTQTIDLSLNENKISRRGKISNSKIFYNKNYTGDDILQFIKSIAEFYDIEPEFIKFSVKNNNESLQT